MGREDEDPVLTEYARLAGQYDRRWSFYIDATPRETLKRFCPHPGDALLDVVNKYAAGEDKGRKFFRELAAKQLAVFKGLGFAAGYLGGMATAVYSEPRKPNDGDNPVRRVMSAGMPAAIWESFAERFQLLVDHLTQGLFYILPFDILGKNRTHHDFKTPGPEFPTERPFPIGPAFG